MVLLSELLGFRLEDRKRQRATLTDVALDLSVGDYPAVTRLLFKGQSRYQSELPWEDVVSLDGGLRRILVQDFREGRAAPSEALTRTVLARRDVLDALVVDVALQQTMRANDLWLRQHEGRLWLAGADVSPWAVLRRLGRGRLGHGGETKLLDWKDLEFLRGDPRLAREGRDYHRAITRLKPPQIARLLDALPYMHAAELLTIIPDDLAADTLEEMTPERQVQVYAELEPDQAYRLVARMASDGATDLLGRLDPEEVQRTLEALPPDRREAIVDLLRYPEDSAGGIMGNDPPFILPDVTIQEARQHLRERLRDPDFVYYVYVVDGLESRRLRGVVTLRDLLLAEDRQRVADVMNPNVQAVDPLMPALEAAHQVAEGGLAALPVAANDGRLVGVVTVDAAVRQLAPAAWRTRGPRVFS